MLHTYIHKFQADVHTMMLQNALIALTTGEQPMLVSDWRHIHNYDRINKPEWKQLKESVFTNLEHWQQKLKVHYRMYVYILCTCVLYACMYVLQG